MDKFQMFAMKRAAAIVPVALNLLPHRADGFGYAPWLSPDPHDKRENWHVVESSHPCRSGVAGGGYPPSNGTGTCVYGTNTHYFSPVP